MGEIIEIGPRFRVTTDDVASDERTLVLAPSPAFGDGRHPSTQMCLQALAVFAPRRPFRLLDVGSGSGILSIGAAKLGGTAIGVEIDEAAIVAARANAKRSNVASSVEFDTAWPNGTFDIVVANILRGVLLGLAPMLTSHLVSDGMLVLSGLVSTDVPEVIARYSPLLANARPEVFERDVWRALVWRRVSHSFR
jgi:ribosomal protein L11 methyltransferase